MRSEPAFFESIRNPKYKANDLPDTRYSFRNKAGKEYDKKRKAALFHDENNPY